MNLKVKPFNHQVVGIDNFVKYKEGYANFSEMGTGKTLISIGAMNSISTKKFRVLIVCPNTLKLNWAKEIAEKSSMKWNVKVLDGPSAKRKESIKIALKKCAEDKLVFITNYESLEKLTPEFKELNLDLIIADEATAIKNHKALKTKALKSLKPACRWVLTGTPIVNNPLDVWSMYDWIRPKHFAPSFYAFRARYANIYTGAGFPVIKGWKNIEELKEKVDVYSMRVLKQDCLDLPEKLFTEIEFDLSSVEQAAYNSMAKDMISEVGEREIVASTALVKMLRLQQMTSGFSAKQDEAVIEIGSKKLMQLKELLEELEGHKVVVWARFKHEINMIEALCASTGRRCLKLTGSESTMQRQAYVEEFQRKDKANTIMVGNVVVGGTGVTLTAASHCIYFSNTWSLADRMQSQDRLHRIGQVNKVSYYDLIAKNTIDQYIISVLNQKIKISDKITGDDLKKILFNS